MNHAVQPPSLRGLRIAPPDAMAWTASGEDASGEDAARLRRLQSLLALLCLYAVALLSVIMLSDGGDIGCVLLGIAGHVLYAARRMVTVWRDAFVVENARHRFAARRLRLRLARA